MFQNSYQNGAYFQLFDPKGTNLLHSASQDKTKNLFKLQAVGANNKVFDKELKSIKLLKVAYVFDFTSASAKILFPK